MRIGESLVRLKVLYYYYDKRKTREKIKNFHVLKKNIFNINKRNIDDNDIEKKIIKIVLQGKQIFKC